MQLDTDGSTTFPMTLDQARDTLHHLAAEASTNYHRVGLIYNHVVEQKLAEAQGYASAPLYFHQQLKLLSQALLSLCGDVARAFTEAASRRYGVYRLSALLTYAQAAGLQPSREEPGPTPIQVPKEDGTVASKPFAECTLDEVKLAVKHLRDQGLTFVLEEDQLRVQAVRASIARHFADDQASRTNVKARILDRTTYLTLQDVPVAHLERLTEALVDGIISARPSS